MSRFLTTAPALADQRYREGLAVFDYDTGLPLDVRGLEAPAAHVGDIRRYEITYRSPMGGRVPASLMIPRTTGSAPGVVLQHGLPGSHDDMAPLGYEIAGLGATVIMIDAPWARPGSDARFTGITFSPEDRANQIQLIVDLRRAVDLLTGLPHVADHRIAYLGVSYGGAMGGLLAGVERRIGSFVLEVGDGGLVTHVTGPEDAGAGFFDLSSRERRRWLAAMEPIEPLYFVRHAAPSALYFQNGTLDEAVPPPDARAYQRAGSEPKAIDWYPSDHLLPAEARCDQLAWLETQIDFPEDPAC